MATNVERQVQEVSNIPEWARPYASQLFGMTFGDPNRPGTGGILSQPYETYGGQRVAGFNPLQTQAFGDIAAMQTAPQLSQATGLAGLAGLRAEQAGQYSPFAGGQFYQSPQFQSMGLDFLRTQAAPSTQYQMGGPERVGADKFGTEQMREYMSPYMEGVVEQQKRGAVQDYLRQLPGIGASSARAGARGGTREALLESEARRGLSERLGGIEAQGLQQAYQQASSQFGQDRAAQMQAALANQATGLTSGQTNLQALINQAQFGAGQGLQSQQLNQAAGLQSQQQAMQQLLAQNQFAQQNAQLGAQYGLQGAQLGEQSRQFGANLGMQGLQQQLASAGMLGTLGGQQYQQQLGIGQAQLGAGAQIQGLEQQNLANRYQDYINAMQYPYKQMEFASGILRGFQPTGTTSTLYQPAGSGLAQTTGLGLGLGGLFGQIGGGP
jgi:hypothetical protein